MVLEGKTGSSRVQTRQASGSEVGLLPEGENGDGYEAVLEPESTSRARSDSSSSDSSSDSSSSDSSVESQEEERVGEYKFDPITEYMIKVGRQDARLDAAWDFYARYTLPTFILREETDGTTRNRHARKYRIQEPGESGGQFYSLWKTPLRQLGDFGAGVGMYFQTLTVFGVVFLLAGLVNTPSILYYRSDSYSDGQVEVNEQISKGSAACTLREVVCLSEDCSLWSEEHRPCEITLQTGLLDWGTAIMFFVILYAVGKLQNRHTTQIDEAIQTAKDYSIMVLDPDPADNRPERWRNFFQRRFGKVTYVTVAVQSGKLMRLLHERFGLIEKIRYEATSQEEEEIAKDPNAIMSRDTWPATWYNYFLMKIGMGADIVKLHERLVAVTAELNKLRGKKKATKVFVTFETEASQRECLKAMTTGVLSSSADKRSSDNEDVIRNGNVLSVCGAPEPGDVIWENLQVSVARRAVEFLVRILVSAALIVIAGFVVFALSQDHPTAAAVFIAVNNAVLPGLMLWLTANPKGGEHHHTNSVYQRSLMLKIVIAQWMNTAFIIYVIQNIDTSPDEAYINQVSKILWADAFVQPLMAAVDIKARFDQYVLAPRQKTQARMNKYFLGKKVMMAERYASMLKTMFVTLFFSAIFPQGYYVAAVALFMTYWSSKYCLFNRWRRPPPSDDSLTIMTRRYVAVALVIKILVSLQFYAGWPFDDLCKTDDTVTQAFADEAMLGDRLTESYRLLDVYPQVGDTVYENCNQDSPAIWRELPEEWMPLDQQTIVWLFSTTGIVMTVLVALMLFGKTAYYAVRRLLEGEVRRSVPRATLVGYSEVEQIEAYIPEVRDPKRPHPLLATDLSHVNTDHISWTGDYQVYNLCSADAFPNMTRKQRAALFSRVAHYPLTRDEESGLPTHTSMRGESSVSDETTPLRHAGLTITQDSLRRASIDILRYFMD